MTRRAAAGLAILLTALTGHPLCNLAFDCGCRWFFAGAEAHCDVQVPAPPNCPACTDMVVGAAFFGAVILGWWLIVRGAAAAAGIAHVHARD